jgi:hypothetical protein
MVKKSQLMEMQHMLPLQLNGLLEMVISVLMMYLLEHLKLNLKSYQQQNQYSLITFVFLN